jgi:anti-sigma regulatory factor (Ser/Thr protein kinase)
LNIFRNTPEFSDLTITKGNLVNSPSEADFCIYDHSTWDNSTNRETDILISGHEDEKNIIELMENHQSFHLIGNSPYLESELNSTLSILSQGHFWDTSHGFPKPIDSKEVQIFSSDKIKEGIDEVLSDFDFTDFFSEQQDILRLLSNELLVNAFYHQLGEDQDRSSTITLEKSIPLQLARNESSVLLRVEDKNGGFPYEKMLASLTRGFKDKTPKQETQGAGLGMYFVFKMSNQVILNLKDNGTEIICMFDINKRYKEYMKRVSSLHYYTGN